MCKVSFTPMTATMLFPIYTRSHRQTHQRRWPLWLWAVILWLLGACRRPVMPDDVVHFANKAFGERRDQIACRKLKTLDSNNIASWPRATAWAWLRLSALCAVRKGENSAGDVQRLPVPFGTYAVAMFHLYRHETQQAVRLLEAISTSHFSDREPAYRLGLIWLLDERFEKALPYFESALQDPVVPQAALRLAIARTLLGLGRLDEVTSTLSPLLSYASPAQLTAAKRLVETSLAFRRRIPPELVPQLEKIRTLLQVEEPIGALDELEKLLPQYAHSALLHYMRGVIHLRLGNTSDAVVELNEVLQIEPHDPEAHMLLGHIYFHAQRDTEARHHLEAAIAANPFLAAAWARLRDVYTRNEAFRHAVDAHKTFMKLSGKPDTTELLITLAHLQEKAGHLEEAVAIHERLVRRQGDEDAFSSLVALARLYLALSTDLNRALEYRRKAATFVRRAEKIRATDVELEKIKERLGMNTKKTKFEKQLRTRGGKPIVNDTNLLE